MSKKKTAVKPEQSSGNEPLAASQYAMKYWRDLARDAAARTHEANYSPDEKQVNELATILRGFCVAVGAGWRDARAICSQAEKQIVRIGCGVVLDCSETPVEVKVTVAFSKKYKIECRSQVPDPNQNELPLEVPMTGQQDDEPELPEDEG